MKNILVLAPGHNELDRRVNRTLDVMVNKFDKVSVVYERRLSVDSRVVIKTNVKYLYIENTEPLLKVVPRLNQYYRFIQNIVPSYDIIYIHDSGVLGLFIAKYVKKKYHNCKVVFDYHDYVQWETYYQINKFFKAPVINGFFHRIVQYALQFSLSRKVLFDGLVGISESQLNSLVNFLNPLNMPVLLSIPNTREKIELEPNKKQSKAISFLWVGNISNGRDLDIIISFLDTLLIEEEIPFKFNVIGQVKSKELFNTLEDKVYFNYMGTFLDDTDILAKLDNDIYIGVFMGWNDALDVKINEIASPNKVYSYLNVGLPVIYNSKLTDLHSILGDSVGIRVGSYEEFVAATKTIVTSYSFYIDNVYQKRAQLLWDSDVSLQLESFLGKIIEMNNHVKQ